MTAAAILLKSFLIVSESSMKFPASSDVSGCLKKSSPVVKPLLSITEGLPSAPIKIVRFTKP